MIDPLDTKDLFLRIFIFIIYIIYIIFHCLHDVMYLYFSYSLRF